MIWTQILGLICIILRFMHVYLRLRSVLAFSSFDCRFVCVKPSFRRKARNWGQLSQEELQRKPNRPKSDDPRKKPANQKEHKTQHSRSDGTAAARGHHGQPVVFTTAHGGGHMVVLPRTHGCASLLLLSCFAFLRGCSISCTFFLIWTDILCLKEGCIWPIWGVEFIV